MPGFTYLVSINIGYAYILRLDSNVFPMQVSVHGMVFSLSSLLDIVNSVITNLTHSDLRVVNVISILLYNAWFG